MLLMADELSTLPSNSSPFDNAPSPRNGVQSSSSSFPVLQGVVCSARCQK